ncbi:hypothetical protein [Candidatus Nitrosotenuis chungbukensis]|nr:hypothetical protein [Candidatus Nitrosotenuis chungbukensis]
MIQKIIHRVQAKNASLPRHRLGFYGFVIVASAVAVILSVF